MLIRTFTRLFNAEPGAAGGGSVDRGDNIPEDQDLDPDHPDAVKLTEDIAAEADAAALQAELDAKNEKADHDETDEAKKNAAKRDARIPLSRHEAVLAKEREKRADLERQLAQLQSGKQVDAANADLGDLETSISGMEKEFSTLLADGQVDKATALMAKIRATERQMSATRSELQLHAMEARTTERAHYNAVVERVEASYPTLNEDHADFDEDLMAEVIDLQAAYQTRGMTPSAALQKAVGLLATPAAGQQPADKAAPRAPARTAAEQRKAAAAVKTADAVGKTPPILAKVGLDGDKLGGGALDARAVMNLNQKDFAKLNEADLARMRGDTL